MRRPILACLAALLAGCAGQPPAEPVPADKVSVHESATSVPANYKVIKRIWVDSWASSLIVPTYASREEAARTMREKAADLGGNGVINFACYQRHSADSLGCNGTVVRFQ